jgi:hypothetical protein
MALTTEEKWSSPQFITLPEGVYRVIGTSKDSNYGHDDKLYLTFEDTLDISLKTEKIVINAKYNNALILFNAEGIEGIEYDSPQTSGVDATPTVCLPFTKLGNVYYHCINNIFTGGSGDRLIINTGAEDDIFLYLIRNTYKPGYYYYFEKIDGNYILPPFKEGN